MKCPPSIKHLVVGEPAGHHLLEAVGGGSPGGPWVSSMLIRNMYSIAVPPRARMSLVLILTVAHGRRQTPARSPEPTAPRCRSPERRLFRRVDGGPAAADIPPIPGVCKTARHDPLQRARSAGSRRGARGDDRPRGAGRARRARGRRRVVGVGTALDAVTRGLSTGLLEQRDLASGTSSRSSKLDPRRAALPGDARLRAGPRGAAGARAAAHPARAAPGAPGAVPLPADPPRLGAAVRRRRPGALRRHGDGGQVRRWACRGTGTSSGARSPGSPRTSRPRRSPARSSTTTARSTTPGWC